jgi:hypothetical protein
LFDGLSDLQRDFSISRAEEILSTPEIPNLLSNNFQHRFVRTNLQKRYSPPPHFARNILQWPVALRFSFRHEHSLLNAAKILKGRRGSNCFAKRNADNQKNFSHMALLRKR